MSTPAVGRGHLLAALEVAHNDGPWLQPGDYRLVNGVVRYSRGDAVNGLSITGMGYRAKWNSTDQVPSRAIDEGIIDRFGALDTTDGGDTYRLPHETTRPGCSTNRRPASPASICTRPCRAPRG